MLLIIDQKTGLVKCNSHVLSLYQDQKFIQKIAVNHLTQVVFYGNACVENRVWRVLAEHGIPAMIISSRGTARSF